VTATVGTQQYIAKTMSVMRDKCVIVCLDQNVAAGEISYIKDGPIKSSNF